MKTKHHKECSLNSVNSRFLQLHISFPISRDERMIIPERVNKDRQTNKQAGMYADRQTVGRGNGRTDKHKH